MPNAPAATHALGVLKLLGQHAEPMPATTIARLLELPRSTTYHLLSVLQREGFVVHLVEERRYGLGVAAFELGSAYSRQAPLQRMARPVLARVVDVTRHTGHFAVLHGRDVLYVLEERAPGRPSLITDVGVRLPASLTASGLSMLAALPPPQVRALFPVPDAFVQRHGVGPTSLLQLRRSLVEVRKRGHAHEDGLVTPGFASVACAVADHSGYPIAAIAVTFPVSEVDPPARQVLAAQVGAAASQLSRRLHARA